LINQFSPARRKALKVIAAVPVTSIVATSTANAGMLSNCGVPTIGSAGQVVDCQLLCRDDGSRVYLLMHNKTESDITTYNFIPQTVRFEGTTINLADAFTKPVTIKAKDRKLIQLKLVPGSMPQVTNDVIELTSTKKYPSVGTRA